MPENKRIRLTKMLIRNALLDLMKTTPFEKISVTAVCKEAEINRVTFYAHYQDLKQVLTEIENDVLAQIPVPTDIPAIYSEDSYLKMLIDLFTYIQKNAEMLSLLMNTGNDRFAKRLIRNVFVRYSEKDLIAHSLTAKYAYIFSVNGGIGLTLEWMNTGFPISAEQFSAIVLSMSRSANIAAAQAERTASEQK